MPTFTVGLLSDTHIPHRLRQLPETVLEALSGVDLILHAGDVDDPAALEPLRAIAPVYAVRGNIHPQDFSDGGKALPALVELQLEGQRLVLTHGHQPGLLGFFLKGLDVIAHWMKLTDSGQLNRRMARRLARLYPDADLIVFGHSHRAHVERVGRALLVNPGAVCATSDEEPTVVRMCLGVELPDVEVIPLPH
jgi:putative phosphoesterase